MAKKNNVALIKEPNCLNCGHPFFHDEKFCPECGQKNKGKKVTIGAFILEVFAGFFSWDAKFWRTLIPLLINPGKVSKDYIEGKRERYSNPFRFYLTVSILFFLIIGVTESYNKFNNLREGSDTTSTNFTLNNEENINEIDIDSIQNIIFKEIDKASIKDSLLVNKKTIDSLKRKKEDLFLSIGNKKIEINRYNQFQKKYPKISTDVALDSLQLEKNFKNRFLYSRLKVFNNMISDKETSNKLVKQTISYASIALFILLPLFTLFLKILYTRRNYTYVEHLVFVFHVQTVFFLLASIFYIIGYTKDTEYITPIFLLLFIIYLFIAMKKFYKQGYMKTFIKYIMANTVFFFLASIGSLIISFIAFALY